MILVPKNLEQQEQSLLDLERWELPYRYFTDGDEMIEGAHPYVEFLKHVSPSGQILETAEQLVMGDYAVRTKQYERLPRIIAGRIAPYSFRVKHIPGELIRYQYLPHVINMVRLFEFLDFSDKYVLDFGAGIGTLGLFALLKSATHVTSIENNPMTLSQLSETKALNGIPDENMTILPGDISCVQLEGIEPSIACANIGSATQPTYVGVDELVWDHVKNSKSIRTVVLGGYIKDQTYDGGISTLGLYNSAGFSIEHTVRTMRKEARIPNNGYVAYLLSR